MHKEMEEMDIERKKYILRETCREEGGERMRGIEPKDIKGT